MNAKLYVVGIGPGGAEHITPAATAAIAAAAVVVGYSTYLELIPELLAGKEVVSSGMMKEIERCRQALDLASAGRTVALVSSGDSGVYGMAGLALELAEDSTVEIEIVPGISAVQAAAARLGAPLMHDFAVISLSDLLTPWELIRRRLLAAGAADFVVALYNPKSKGRLTARRSAADSAPPPFPADPGGDRAQCLPPWRVGGGDRSAGAGQRNGRHALPGDRRQQLDPGRCAGANADAAGLCGKVF